MNILSMLSNYYLVISRTLLIENEFDKTDLQNEITKQSVEECHNDILRRV